MEAERSIRESLEIEQIVKINIKYTATGYNIDKTGNLLQEDK